jgi:hypothetical protein
MVDLRDDEGEPEQLAGGDVPRLNWSVIAVVVVLVAGAVLLARANHHDRPAADRHQLPTQPLPAPEPTSVRRAHLGSVFLEHLPQCTRTDHRHRLSLAMGVTNLGGHGLRLVGASGVTSNALVVAPVGFRIGSEPCASAPGTVPFFIAPGHAAVVALTFRVGSVCPRHALVSAEVAFDAGAAGVVHADSSQLANLDQLNFVQCA